MAAGTAGLGLGAAKALAAEGVRVAVCGRDPARLQRALTMIREHGEAVGFVADVSTEDGATGFVDQSVERLGGVDILVANAGGPPPGTFASTSLDDYQAAMHLNFMSTVAMCRAAVPSMQERLWGRVVGITSVGARQPIDGLIASVAARAAVTGFLKSLAFEVAPDGVTVNSIQPGPHLTARAEVLDEKALAAMAAQLPTGRLGDADDFGAVVAFLCSERANHIVGAAVAVDGGWHKGLQ